MAKNWWEADPEDNKWWDADPADETPVTQQGFSAVDEPTIEDDLARGGMAALDAKAVSSVDAAPQRSAADYGKSLLEGATNFPASLVGLVDLFNTPHRAVYEKVTGDKAKTVTELLADIGVDFGRAKGILAESKSSGSKVEREEVNDAFSDGGVFEGVKALGDNPQVVAETVVQAVPEMMSLAGMVRTAAVSVFGKAVKTATVSGLGREAALEAGRAAVQKAAPKLALLSSTLEGAQSAGSASAEYAAEGRLKEREALAALASGVGVATIGAAANKLGAKIGLEDVETALASSGLRGGQPSSLAGKTGGAIAGAFKGGVKEGVLEEATQSALEQASQNFANRRDLGEGVGQAAVEGFLAGSVLGAGGGGFAGARTDNAADHVARALAQDVDSAAWAPGSADQIARDQLSPENAQYTRAEAPSAAPIITPDTIAKTLAEAAGLPKVTPQQPERVKWKSPDGIDYPVTVVNPDIETDDGGRAALVNYNGVEMLVPQEQLDRPRTIDFTPEDSPTRAAGLPPIIIPERVNVSQPDAIGTGAAGSGLQQDIERAGGLAPSGPGFVGERPDTVAPGDVGSGGAPVPVGDGARQSFTGVTLPRVDEKKVIPFGPATILPKVAAADKPLYRETNPMGLDDLLMDERDFTPANFFVTDNADLALGQGDNKGVKITFRPNALSGRENVKPGTAIPGVGKEFKVDASAPSAIQQITMFEKSYKGLRKLSRVSLDRDFDKVALDDGSLQFTRKGTGEWQTFAPESGTLNVPRAEMPQVKAEHRGALANFLKARGIQGSEETVPASSLMPTQAEFSPAKVKQAMEYTGGNRAILVSTDNRILDGHHQWLAAREKGEDVRVIRMDAPIQDLIQQAHEFPSSTKGETYDSGLPVNLAATRTPAIERLESGLNRWRSSAGLADPVKYEEISRDGLPDALGGAVAAFEGFTGAKVAVVRNLTPETDSWNGLTFRDNTVFVDETAEAPVVTVAAHEFTHNLRRSDPALYQILEDEVRGQGLLSEWEAKLTRSARGEKVDPDMALEELTSNAVGDAMSDKVFLQKLAKRNPGKFRQLADAFINFLNQFLGSAKDLGSNQYLRDVEKFRDLLADVLEQYTPPQGAGQQQAPVQSTKPAFSRKVSPLGLYSALAEKVGERKNATARADEWKAIIRGLPGVKKDEIEWSGVTDWLDTQKGPIPRESVVAYLESDGVQVEEVVLGYDYDRLDAIAQRKYGTSFDYLRPYQRFVTVKESGQRTGHPRYVKRNMADGRRHRELLLTFPAGSGFTTSHWDQPGVLVHVRLHDRITPDSKRVLFVQEIQSDWGQSANKGKDVPDAPFIRDTNSWVTLALKRVITFAVQQGYDQVAVTNGHQAAMANGTDYTLSKVSYAEDSSKLTLTARDSVQTLDASRAELPTILGGELATRLMSTTPARKITTGLRKVRELEGGLLQVKNDGLRSFYDELVPRNLQRVARSIGATLSEINLPVYRMSNDTTLHTSITITHKVREAVVAGLPMFSRRGDGRAFTGFFTNITQGFKGAPSGKAFEPVLDILAITPFVNEYNKHRGNFDDHIGSSIPTFRELQTVVGDAIAKTFDDADMLDIGASEGALIKAVTKLSDGKVRTVAVDPAPAMGQHFNKGEKVPGAVFEVAAFGSAEEAGTEAWVEGDTLTDRDGTKRANPFVGRSIPFYKPDRQFDIVHEAMVFQFVNSDRAEQVARIKELMKPDGVAILEEKFIPGEGLPKSQFDANEAQKDVFKEQYFSKEEIDAKAKAVGVKDQEAYAAAQAEKEEQVVGMADLMVAPGTLEQVLQDNFAHVVQFWDAGNFKGYMASDDRATLDKLLGNMEDVNSEFSNVETPRWIEPAFSRKQTDTPAFKKWFGDSKVVDENGEPLVVYHGGQRLNAWGGDSQIYGSHAAAVKKEFGSMLSDAEIEKLDNPVFFFTEDEYVAEGYGDQGDNYEVRPSYLRVSNPLDLREDGGAAAPFLEGYTADELAGMRHGTLSRVLRADWIGFARRVKTAGFDGIVFHDTDVYDRGDHIAWAVFSPTQIKSATGNQGTFDPENPDIRFSRKGFNPDRKDFNRRIKEDGGVTYNADGSVFTSKKGYAVGLMSSDTEVGPGAYRAMMDFADTHANLLSYPSAKIGAFVFDDGRRMSIDLSMVTDDRDLAVRLGEQNNQDSVWDYAKSKLIKTGGDGAATITAADVERALFDEGLRKVKVSENLLRSASLANAIQVANGQKFSNMLQLKESLQKAVQSELRKAKIDPDSRDFAARAYLHKAALADVREALRSNANAVGWYEHNLGDAKAVLTLTHPELATDPDAEFAFLYALAVTSNGMKVDKNFTLAEQAYETWKRSGRMPTDIGQGNVASAINAHLAAFDVMVENHGMAAFRAFMTQDRTVREVNEFTGGKISGENLDTVVLGAAILGPKIGNGFFGNLYGRFDKLTMDRWFMRTWGRWNGNLVQVDKEKVAANRLRVRDAIANIGDKKAFEAIIGAKLTPGNHDAVATRVQTATKKPENRRAMALIEGGDELRKSGNQLAKLLDGQKEAPANGGERDFIRTVVTGALDSLRDSGFEELTMADLQALLWYAEKRLYDRAASADDIADGYNDDDAPNYRNAAIALARQKGVPEDKIQSVLRYKDETGFSSGPAERDPVETPAFSRKVSPLGLYSTLAEKVGERKNATARADEWKAIIRGLPGVKKDEIEWSGVTDWLDTQKGPIPRESVVAYLENDGVRVEEVALGSLTTPQLDQRLWDWAEANPGNTAAAIDRGESLDTIAKVAQEEGDSAVVGLVRDGQSAKYDEYQLPGGTNYRNVLLTLPEKRRLVTREEANAARAKISSRLTPLTQQEYDEMVVAGEIAKAPADNQPYKSAHWDQPNILAHVRLNDRVDADGAKVLFVEEIQSDLGQDTRKQKLATVSMNIGGEMEATKFKDFADYMKNKGSVITQPGFTITPEMRETVAAGLPMFSRKSVVGNQIQSAWSAPDPSKMDTFIYKIQDKQIDTKRVIGAINTQVGQIKDQWDPYLQETLYHGRAAEGVARFLDNELKPLFRDMIGRGETLESLEEFLTYAHAKEVNAYVRKVNPTFNGPGSGIDDADVTAYLAALPLDKRNRLYGLSRQVWDVVRTTQDLLVSSGLETQETIDKWRSVFPFYVPYERDNSDDFGLSGLIGAGTGQGFSIKGKTSKRLTGSKKPVINVVANIAMQRERAVTRAEKNRVALALYGLAVQNPNTDYWLPINPDAKLTAAGSRALQAELVSIGLNPLDARGIVEEPKQPYVDPQTGLVVQRVNPLLRNNPNVLSVKINGMDRHLIFNANSERAARMVEALKNLDTVQLGEVASRVAPITRYLASINTQYNPIFGVTNFTRDVQFAALSLSATPLAGKQVEVLSHVGPALHGVYQDLRSRRKLKGSTNTQWAALWEEFKSVGGQTGYRAQFLTSEDRAKDVTRVIKRLNANPASKGFHATFDWLSDYNEAIENSIRLSAYKVGLDNGMSKERAAELAKNLTVNFNRKGLIGQTAGAWYAFFNAAVQGTETLVRTLKGPAGKQIIAGGLLLGVAQAMALALAGFGEDEPPEFIKERNLVIPLFNDDKDYLTIPMPLGFHVIPNVSRKLTEGWLSDWNDTTGMVVDLITIFAESFNPMGSSGASLQTIAPSVADPLVALAENRDWGGKPIYQESFSNRDVSPGTDRARDTASIPSKYLAEFFNAASGGTDFVAGGFSPTPDQIDYLIGQATGGVGREGLKLGQLVETAFTGEELPSHKIPLGGRFYGSATGASSAAGTYYDNLARMTEHRAEIEGRRESGQPVETYFKENPESRYAMEATMSENAVRQLRRAKREAVAGGESKERVKELEQKIQAEMTRFNLKVDGEKDYLARRKKLDMISPR